MRKITQDDLDRLKSRGVTVKSKGVPKKETPAPDSSLTDAVKEIGDSNKEVIEAFGEEIKTLVKRPRGSWQFTINRDSKGRLESVTADPI